MNKMVSSSFTVATLYLLLFTSSAASASEILIVAESLNTLPSGYLLYSNASTNATADIQIGNVGSSNKLIYDGSWDVPANGSEESIGLMYPNYFYQFDPGDTDGITSVRWTLEAEVISANMEPPEQGIFVQLIVYQQQADNSFVGFVSAGTLIQAGQSVSLNISSAESDFGVPGARPDFSASGRPIAFGLQIGAIYPRENNPQAFFVNGRLTAFNWTVSVSDVGGVFSDGFESESSIFNSSVDSNSGLGAANLGGETHCQCPSPPPAFNLLPELNR